MVSSWCLKEINSLKWYGLVSIEKTSKRGLLMNNDTESYRIPELVRDLLTDKISHPDNMVADLIN